MIGALPAISSSALAPAFAAAGAPGLFARLRDDLPLWLTSGGWAPGLVLGLFAFFVLVLPAAGFATYFERKICALIQNRTGPNRVGPRGLLQWVADAIKLLLKEDITPDHVDRALYTLAPVLAFAPGVVALAVIPLGSFSLDDPARAIMIAHVDVGLLFVLAVTSLSAYGVAFGGWASNNKFSLLGGLRSSAQLVSYEIAAGLALVSLIMTAQTVETASLVHLQQGTIGGVLPNYFAFRQPLAFLIFLIAAFAEGNRLPFDLPEAEPELVGGYHTEYSSMKFALFFLGEYAALIMMSLFLVTLFLGGWHVPGVNAWLAAQGAWWHGLGSMAILLGKTAAVLFFFMWVRWTLPRFRYDQLMHLGWKVLIPLALVNIVVTGLATAGG